MRLYYTAIFVLILVDQFTKYFIKGVENYGSAFGLFQGGRLLFIFLGFATIFLLILYRKKLKELENCGGLLLISGVTGNLLDRIFLGYVRDFIDLGFWPSFNFADVYIVIGACLFLFSMIKKN